MKEIKPLKNEDGTILVISLIVLALASMIGIAATMTASLELQISGNDRHYAENFYRAEAATMVGARAIEGTLPAVLRTGKFKAEGETGDEIPLRISTDPTGADFPDIYEDNTWTDETGQISAAAPDAISNGVYKAKFLPVNKGVPPGDSLDQTAITQINEFTIYGRSILETADSSKKLSEVIIEVGYRRRF